MNIICLFGPLRNLKLWPGLDVVHIELGKITCLEDLKVPSTLFSRILLNHLACCIVLLLICFCCPLYTCESISLRKVWCCTRYTVCIIFTGIAKESTLAKESFFAVRSYIRRELTVFSCFLLWLKQILIQWLMHTESV